ncbi:MAG: hypothetical protein JSS30_06740 [Verrucomicrobia bacterium]|nr:hypothetical protein [Verrucomicrobiota bacterium]
MPIEISTATLGMQVSKSRKLPILIDAEEMRELLAVLGEFSIFDVSRKVSKESAEILKADFLKVYSEYVNGIKTGKLIDEAPLRPYFSAIFTLTTDVLYALPVGKDHYLIKAKRPVVQLQRHHFIYTDTFHSGVMGAESVTWGIQFSYPQLFLDPETNAIGKVEKNPNFPNTELFQNLAVWVRNNTVATPFVVQGKVRNQPIRLGKRCFTWINNHPALKARNLYVADRKNPSPSD